MSHCPVLPHAFRRGHAQSSSPRPSVVCAGAGSVLGRPRILEGAVTVTSATSLLVPLCWKAGTLFDSGTRQMVGSSLSEAQLFFRPLEQQVLSCDLGIFIRCAHLCISIDWVRVQSKREAGEGCARGFRCGQNVEVESLEEAGEVLGGPNYKELHIRFDSLVSLRLR